MLRNQKKYLFACLTVCFGLYVIIHLYRNNLDKTSSHDVILSKTEDKPKPSQKRILNENSSNPIENYYRYPCIKELDLNNEDACVRTICTDDACKQHINCTALPLKIINNTPICTYDPKYECISRIIRKTGTWEGRLVKGMIQVLNRHPDMMLVDVGCNIGVFTLIAAKMARRVICIDANYENIQMVYTSLALSNLSENVTFVWNGLSSERSIMKLNLIKSCIGMSQFGDVKDPFKVITVQSIQLDELQPLIKGRKVFMKMDVELHELHVVQGGSQFFKNIDVRYIQTEFRSRQIRMEMARLLAGHGFQLYRDLQNKQPVALNDTLGLPNHDVYFIKPSEIL